MLPFDAPTPELARELAEVRVGAKELIEYFDRNLNAPLPTDFPKETVVGIAHELMELEDGTARGCTKPLLYSDQQLSEIRSQHILIENSEGQLGLRDSPPSNLSRGQSLDFQFMKLLSAISTARRVADRIAATEPTDEKPEASVPRPDAPVIHAISSKARAAEGIAVDARRKLDSVRAPESSAADNLRRKITDAKVLSHLGRIELAQPRVMPGWLERIGSSLKDYPNLIERSGRALRLGVDVVERAHHHVVRYEELTFSALTSVLRGVAIDFEAIGRKLNDRRKKKNEPENIETEEMFEARLETNFEATSDAIYDGGDTALPPSEFSIGKAKQMILARKTPPSTWAQFIDEISFAGSDLSDLTPISHLRFLRSLDLSGTAIETISGLQELHLLEQLDLSVANISDLSSLESLKSLQGP